MSIARSPRPVALALATAVIGALAASCVLLVAPASYGEHCKFAGADTACGRCLKDRCQVPIDDCCGDEACAETLAAVEACSTRTDASCDALAFRASKGGHEGTLAACAATSCGPVCRSFTGASNTSCSEPAFGRGATCACSYAPGAGNDFDCSPATYPATVCCAPKGWPDQGLECSCRPLGCNTTPDGCACALVDTPPEVTQCSNIACCASPDECVCRDKCYDLERPVPSCSLNVPDAIGCKKGQVRVDSCTLRTP